MTFLPVSMEFPGKALTWRGWLTIMRTKRVSWREMTQKEELEWTDDLAR